MSLLTEEEVREALRPFVDLFGGADGGVGFAKLRVLMETSDSPQIPQLLGDLAGIGKLLTHLMEN